MIRSASFSIRVSLNILDELEKTVVVGKFSSIAEAMRFYIQLGMKIESYESIIKDPAFLEKIEDLKQGDKIFHWTETLTDTQLDSVSYALKMEKDRRFEKGYAR